MLNKILNEKQYNAILHNCNNYKLIYSDKNNIDNKTLSLIDTICTLTGNDDIDVDLTTNNDTLNQYYSIFNTMRVFFDNDTDYFINDTDYFICDFETLLFIDTDIFISNNIKIKCNSKFKYDDKIITICSVYNTTLNSVLPIYKFVVIGTYVYGTYHHYEIYSKIVKYTNSKHHLMAMLQKQAIENIMNIAHIMNIYSLFDKKTNTLINNAEYIYNIRYKFNKYIK